MSLPSPANLRQELAAHPHLISARKPGDGSLSSAPVASIAQESGPRSTAPALWAALAIVSGLVFATTAPVARVARESLNPWHHYEYLAEGFASGHTYLSLDPPKELLAYANPYLPSSLPDKRLWDASLYHGRYYLYFGPAPAAALMLPWRLATGNGMAQWVAASLWAVIGLAGLLLLLKGIRDRHFPGVRPLWLGFVAIVAFHASWFPVLLRRPGVWELPIVAEVACAWWSLYFLWRFHESGHRTRWALLLGAALGLMIGSRVNSLFAAALLIGLLLVPTIQGGPRLRLGPILLGGGLVTLAGLSLLAYNHARFGAWTEFGTSFQLWGADYRGTRFMDPAYILFNARAYLLSIPSFSPYFPFIHPAWPDSLPRGHMGTEELHGILFAAPVHLAGLGALALAWRLRHDASWKPLGVTLAGALGVIVLFSAVLFAWGGLCSRYIAELCTGMTVLTGVGLLAAVDPGAGRAGRGLRVALVVAASVWTIGYTWLASADFKGYMKRTSPGVYAALAHAADYPSLWQARRQGEVFGPVDLVVRVPAGTTEAWTPLLASGRPGMTNQLVLERTAGDRYRFLLIDDRHTSVATPELEPRAGTLRVRVEAPWLYPPTEHPYWDGIADPATRARLQSLFLLGTERGEVQAAWTHAPDPVAYEPTVRAQDPGDTLTPWVASLVRTGDPAGPEGRGP